ncbi:MAG: hypothetical protein CMO55_09730 [Verrucomicrobiales bacterium]|nr:hypothetical protein [Verrucomicrobiales bacterium]
MDSSEEELVALEAEFPLLSGTAFEQAKEDALRSGLTVLYVRNGKLLRQHPNGTEEFVKEVETLVDVEKGSKISIPK